MGKLDTISGKKGRELEDEAVRSYLEKNPSPKSSQKIESPKSSREVYRIKAMFPFQLFPDELIIYPESLSYIINTGPGMKIVRDLYIKDIAQIQGNAGPIFGNLRITSKLQTEDPIIIDRAKRSDVLKAREVLQGLLNKMQEPQGDPDEPQEASIY